MVIVDEFVVEGERVRNGEDVTRVEEDHWRTSFAAIHCDPVSWGKLSKRASRLRPV